MMPPAMISVTKVLYDDQQDRVVFRGTDGAGVSSRYVSHRALPRCPVVGECWGIESQREEHPDHGVQQRVTAGRLLRPTGAFIVHVLANHPRLRGLGVGEVTARKLFTRHGASLADVLERQEIASLPELDPDMARELCERWQTLALEPQVVRWLDEKGLDAKTASKIVSIYRGESIAAMETNPYVLLPFIPFSKIDRFAQMQLGITSDDPRRLVAAVEAALHTDVERGHTATARDNLMSMLIPSVSNQAARALDIALNQEIVFERNGFIQAYSPALMETGIAKWIRRGLEALGSQGGLGLMGEDEHLNQLIDHHAHADGMPVTDEQREAVVGAIKNKAHCIIGGAGVGKTSVLRLLGRVVVARQGQIFYMAISGRATRRIAESLGSNLASACTIKTVAGYLKSVAQTLPKDSTPWLVVDEASMLDLRSGYKILALSPPGAHLILVGDPHQLPPVGAGLVFHRFVENPVVPRTELTRIFRQTEATGIPAIAGAVRAGVVPHLPPFVSAGEGVQASAVGRPQDAVDEAIRIRDVLAQRGSVQILTLFRRQLGATAVNNVIHGRIPASTARLKYPLGVAVGEPVIFTKNDPELNLQNGSLGITRAIDLTACEATVLWDDGVERVMDSKTLWNCDLAYGITTHRSQGSQYDRVVVLIPRASIILDRSLLYTAITRARFQCVIVGDIAAVRAAVARPTHASNRNVLLFSDLKHSPP